MSGVDGWQYDVDVNPPYIQVQSRNNQSQRLRSGLKRKTMLNIIGVIVFQPGQYPGTPALSVLINAIIGGAACCTCSAGLPDAGDRLYFLTDA